MIFIVYGTRAELIKFSPLIRELKRRKAHFNTVDIGQHDNSSLVKSLKLPQPDFHLGSSYRSIWSNLEASSMTYPVAATLALLWGFKVFVKLPSILSKGDVVVTHGNAMGVPLSIYASKLSSRKPKLVHMESGFRGNTKSTSLLDFFYEFADFRSDLLFAPFKSSEKNLRTSGVKGKVILSGDVMKEVVRETLKIKPKIKIPRGDYVVANITRSIFNKTDAKHLLHALADSPIDVILIMNPVIKRRIEKFELKGMLKSKRIKTMNSMDYPDFLHLLSRSKGAITDSNGVEEECAALCKPCLVTNDFLQIPEFEDALVVKRVGCNYIGLLGGLRKIKDGRWRIKNQNILGKGNSTKLIADYLISLEGRSR
jgi:UDP-N-acetylglucosamine 2-epimerase (non-hydrolysing)